jgi:glycosyltransferase involved in cell wall biosynthesis
MTTGLRIGLYDRALSTLGGGERFALAVAEYLARNHAVTVITHRPTDRATAAQRLGLDLSDVAFAAIPDRSTAAMASITEEYDLFIGASHGECVPCRAATGILLVHFPQPPLLEGAGQRLRRRLKLLLRELLMQPSFEEGVFAIRTAGDSQARLLAERTTAALPPSPTDYVLTCRLAAADASVMAATLELDGVAVGSVKLPADGSSIRCRVRVPAASRGNQLRLIIRADAGTGGGAGPVKLSLSSLRIEDARYRLFESLLQVRQPAWGLSLQYVPPVPPPLRSCIDTYQTVWANSRFSQEWINRYWQRKSSVLYPPVDTVRIRPGPKKQQILSVGRFFAGQHNKKHGLMIRAFRAMVDAGLSGWEMHLVGGSMPGEASERYLARLRELAKGYPISIQTDVDSLELVRFYAESAIYWHASGYGENEERHPERFEHFGITTVEAMAAGCVPVVIGKGGQPEIVQHERNGMLWHTMDQLRDLTWRLIRDEDLRCCLAVAACEDSKRFGQPRFESELQTLLSQIGID